MKKINEYWEKLRLMEAKARLRLLLGIMLVLIALALYLSFMMPEAEPKENAANETLSADALSAALSEILSKVEGAGKTQALICYASTDEVVPAYLVESEGDAENFLEKESLAQSGGDALILRRDMPKIRGVIVVAEGADDIATRMRLQAAAVTLLGIDNNKVEVLPMQGEKYGG